MCPAGRYGSTTGLSSSLCSGPCDAGYLCPAGSVGPRQNVCGGVERYCPQGDAGSPRIAPVGKFTVPESGSPATRSGIQDCPPNDYCSGGERSPVLQWSGTHCKNTFDAVLSENQAEIVDIVTLQGTSKVGGAIWFSIAAAEPTGINCGSNPFRISGTKLQSLKAQSAETCARWKITLRAFVSSYQSTPCELTIEIVNVNEPPTFLPLADSYAIEERSPQGTQIIKMADYTSDPENGELAFSFHSGHQRDGSDVFSISACTGTISVLRPDLILAGTATFGVYELQVRVLDDDGVISFERYASVKVTVLDVNDPPSLLTASLTVDENSAAGTQLFPILHAADADNDVLKFGFGPDCADCAAFSISENGQVSVVDGSKLNFEDVSAQPNSLKIRVWDSRGGQDERVVSVQVKNVNDMPLIVAPPFVPDVDESALAGQFIAAFYGEDEDGDDLVFSLCEVSDVFALSADGQLTVKASGQLDFEVQRTQTFDICLKDVPTTIPAAQLQTRASVTVKVNDINEAPVWKESALTGTALEAREGEAVVLPKPLSFEVDDPEGENPIFSIEEWGESFLLFQIRANGELQTTSALDYDGPVKQHTIRIVATDQGVHSSGGAQSSTIDLIIEVRPVNEVHSLLAESELSVLENCAPGTIVGNVGIQDPEGKGPDQFKFALIHSSESTTSNAASRFEVDENGNILVHRSAAAPIFDFDSPGSRTQYTVAVQANDTSEPFHSATLLVTIRIDDVNEGPVFENPLYFRTVAENAMQSSSVGPPIQAHDPERHPLTFAFVATDGSPRGVSPDGLFAIDASSGQVVSWAAPPLALGVHNYSIQVADYEFSARSNLSVLIINTNDAPILMSASQVTIVLDEGQAPSTQHTLHSQICEDKDFGHLETIMHSIDGSVPSRLKDYFAVFPTSGRRSSLLQSVAAPDFEAEADQLAAPNSDRAQGLITLGRIQLKCTDELGMGAANDTIVTIKLRNVNEGPKLIFPQRTMSVPESSETGIEVNNGCFEVNDPDFEDHIHAEVNLLGQHASYFALKNTSSTERCLELSTLGAQHLNFEADERIELQIKVIDGVNSSLFLLYDVAVDVVDVNEKPTAQLDWSMNPRENEEAGLVIAEVSATDPDSSTTLFGQIRFRLENVSGIIDSLLEVQQVPGTRRAKVRTTAPLDFEAANHFRVLIVAEDGGIGATASVIEASFDIQNVNDLAIMAINSDRTHRNAGGEMVVFHGTGLLPIWSNHELHFTATYRSKQGLIFRSPSCFTGNSSTSQTLHCVTAPGFGTGLVWTIVRSDGDNITLLSPHLTTTYSLHLLQGLSNVDSIPTIGKSTICAEGANFPPPGLLNSQDIRLQYATSQRLYTATHCTVQSQGDKICCNSVAGYGHSFVWSLSILGLESAPFVAGSGSSYSRPTVTDIHVHGGKFLKTVGGSRVTINGTNFGPADARVAARFGPLVPSDLDSGFHQRYLASCEHNDLSPHHTLECTTPPGIGVNHTWTVQIGDLYSESSSVTSDFRSPTVSSVIGIGNEGADTRGGQQFFIRGRGFGPTHFNKLPTDFVVVYENSYVQGLASGCSVVEADILISCLTGPGVGSNIQLSVKVGQQTAPQCKTCTFWYSKPVLASYSTPPAAQYTTATLATTGHQHVFLAGNFFGEIGTPIEEAFYGNAEIFNATNCTVVTSHTLVSCLTSSGAGALHDWTLKIAGQFSEGATTSYAPPQITHFSGIGANQAAIHGGDAIIVHGSNFASTRFLEKVSCGPTGTEFLVFDKNATDPKKGSSACLVLNSSAISCLTPPGVGIAIRWVVTVASQASEPSNSFTSYAPPYIADVSPSTVPTSGKARNLVPFGSSSQVPVQLRLSGLDLFLANQLVETIVYVQTSPDTRISDSDWDEFLHLNRDGRKEFSASRDQIEKVQNMLAKCATFSSAQANGLMKMESDSTLLNQQVSVPAQSGFGVELIIAVSVGGIFSNAVRYSYSRPQIERVLVSKNSLTGMQRMAQISEVILQGTSFCDGNSYLPPNSTLSESFGAALPSELRSCGRVIVNGKDMQQYVTGYNHNKISLLMKSVGVQRNQVQIIVSGNQTSDVAYFQDSVPMVSRLNQGSVRPLETQGGELFTIKQVSDIAAFDPSEVRVTIGGRECTDVHFDKTKDCVGLVGISALGQNDASLVCDIHCRTPEGSGREQSVEIISPGGLKSEAGAFKVDYAPPSVSRWVPIVRDTLDWQNHWSTLAHTGRHLVADKMMWAYDSEAVPTSGGLLVVHGSNLGNASSSGVRIEIDKYGKGPSQPLFCNHTHALMLVPPGRGMARVTLSVSGQAFNFDIRYAAPKVLQVSPKADILAAGQSLQVMIRGLGGDPTPEIYLSSATTQQRVPCAVDFELYSPNASLPDTTVVCSSGAASGSNFAVFAVSHDPDLDQSSIGCENCMQCASKNRPCRQLCNDERGMCRSDCQLSPSKCMIWGSDCGIKGESFECDVSCASQAASCLSSCSCQEQCSECPTVSYAQPSIFRIEPQNISTSGLTDSGEVQKISVHGLNFGPSLGPFTTKLRELAGGVSGKVASERIINSTRSDRLIEFFARPYDSEHVLFSVRAQDQPSSGAGRINIQPPAVKAVQRLGSRPEDCEPKERCEELNPLYTPYFNASGSLPSDGVRLCRSVPGTCFPTAGGFDLLIIGTSFGSGSPNARRRVQVGALTCAVQDDEVQKRYLDPHSHIVCRMPPGVGEVLPIVVQVGGMVSDAEKDGVNFGFDPPSIRTVMPNTPDARGDELVIRGTNFGTWETQTEISVQGKPCLESEWLNNAAIRCKLDKHIAGPQNISVRTANRSEPIDFHDWEMRILSECKPGSAGLWGESCIDCSLEARGSKCPGGETIFDLVTALPGFWRANLSTPNSNCHADRQMRNECPVFKPCEPSWACTGENTCLIGYEGDRCAFCLKGEYYRINGVCQKCPDRPWVILVGFAAAIMIGSSLSYWLNKKDANIAFITIGVDYFQVLAMLARARVRWPATVMQLYNVLSAFNFNLELAAPECSVPDISTQQKFLMSIALPVGTLFLLSTHVVCGYLYNRVIRQSGASLAWTHVNSTIAAGTVAFYFLYMYITRVSLDVFNCAPTDPPDGNLYMAGRTDIICFESPVHKFMIPFAAATAVLYVIGFPAFILWLLRRNKLLVVCDQVRRSFQMSWRNTKNDSAEEKRGFAFRKRWQRLYFLFRPERAHYWITVILARKLAVAFTSLMFTTTPVFQMAASLLVMFFAFVAQVRNAPYLGAKERVETAELHQVKVRMGDSLALLVEDGMNASRAMAAKRTHGTSLKSAADAGLTKAKGIGAMVLNILLDYNNAESVLLGCAVLVNLFGIMFLSNRFSGEMLQYHQAEYDALAYGTLLVISASVIYFLVLLALELLVMLSPQAAQSCVASCVCTKKAATRLRRADSIRGKGVALGAHHTSELHVSNGVPAPAAHEEAIAIHSNPFMKMAIAERSEALRIANDETEESAAESGVSAELRKLDPETLPTKVQWQRVCRSAHATATVLKGLRAQLNELSRELQDVKTSKQLRSATMHRREFVPSRLGDNQHEELPPPSSAPSPPLAPQGFAPTSNPLLRRGSTRSASRGLKLPKRKTNNN